MPIVEVSLPILPSCDVRVRFEQGAQATSSPALEISSSTGVMRK